MVRYAHEQRFRVARELVAAADPPTILDYGCGDGHFLIGLLDADLLSPAARVCAFEPIASVVQLLRTNLEAHDYLDRVEVVTELDQCRDAHFDFVACMGVLEHLPVGLRFDFYNFLEDALAEDGRALIDVPIEIGPSILIKEFGRRVLKSDPPDYSIIELLRIAVGGAVFDPQRFDPTEAEAICRHRGFDHRILRQELERRFEVVHTTPTPLSHLPTWLGNQELLLTLRRPPVTAKSSAE